MRKFLLFFLLLVLIGAAGVAVFLATFDADRYRPVVVRRMSEAVGRPVQLEKISLRWDGGIAAELRGLTVDPGLRAERITAVLKPLSLLKGNIRLGTVKLVCPEIRLVRKPTGAIEVEGLAPPPSGSPSSRPAKTASLLVRQLEVEEGTVHWSDPTTAPPRALTLRRIHLTLRNVSFTGPISIRGEAALFRAEPNIRLTGEVIPPLGSRPLSIKELDLEADLTGLQQEEVARAVPTFREVSAEGKVHFQMDRMELGPQGPSGRLRLRVEQGRLLRLNLLRELFSRLTVIPGLMETLSAHLPDSYRQKFEAQDTAFQPIDLWLSASGQGFVMEGTRLAADSFELAIGQARIGMEGSVSASARFRADEALSKAMVQSVEELRFLTDESDRLTLPVVVQGILPKVTILPDLNFVTRQLFSTKGEELLGGLLQKVLKKK